MPKAFASAANVLTCGTRSERSIMERNDTLMPARSASASCVSESVPRSSRMRRPNCVPIVAPSRARAAFLVPGKRGGKILGERVKRSTLLVKNPSPLGTSRVFSWVSESLPAFCLHFAESLEPGRQGAPVPLPAVLDLAITTTEPTGGVVTVCQQQPMLAVLYVCWKVIVTSGSYSFRCADYYSERTLRSSEDGWLQPPCPFRGAMCQFPHCRLKSAAHLLQRLWRLDKRPRLLSDRGR
jgi:hypothetical protein